MQTLIPTRSLAFVAADPSRVRLTYGEEGEGRRETTGRH